MDKLGHYLFLGVDYLLSFILLGAGQLGALMPRLGETEPVIPDTPGIRMVEQMGPGWNLGNTLCPFSDGFIGPEAETSWGNPRTTPEMLAMVKAAGFTCVRIPATWSNHLIDDNYTIDPLWIGRVQEIVDYAYNLGLYVILNMHHDDYCGGYIPDKANEAQTTERYIAVWAQIAERFKNYGERLLFEAINEPRVEGSLLEWIGGTHSQRQVVNRLHAAFVKIVRASGGNNAERWLLLPTYGASSLPYVMKALRLPEGDERLIVSVHAYVPHDFAMNTPEAATYGDKEKKELEKTLGRIYDRFIKKGIPVYLDEFGAVDKGNMEDRARYFTDYTAIAARYGMRCAVWDDGGDFRLLDRSNLRWLEPEVVRAIMGVEVF